MESKEICCTGINLKEKVYPLLERKYNEFKVKCDTYGEFKDAILHYSKYIGMYENCYLGSLAKEYLLDKLEKEIGDIRIEYHQ